MQSQQVNYFGFPFCSLILYFFFADILTWIFSGPSENNDVGQELVKFPSPLALGSSKSQELDLLNRDSLNEASAHNTSEETTQVPTDRIVALPQSPSPVYCLLDLYEDQNIIDRNMNMILNRIRLIKSGDIFETFGNGWSFERRHSQEQNPQQLVLHRFGTPPSQESFQELLKQVRRKELFDYIPGLHAATEREVMVQLQRCNLSRILSTNFLERGLSYNYVLINGGKGPIVWRMW